VQGAVAQALDASHREHPLAGRFAEDRARVLAHGFDVVQYAARSGPPALAEDAGTRTVESPREACARHCVARARDDGPATPEDYLARAILRPCSSPAERGSAPEASARARLVRRSAAAPFGGLPARRDRERRRGALARLRSCGLEWRIGRVRCATCLEPIRPRLPGVHRPQPSGVRIEGVESCKRT